MVSPKHVSVVAEEETGHEEDYKDDNISIREVIQTMRGKRGSRDGGELGEINGCSTFTTKGSAQLVKTKAKRVRVSQCGLDFVEPKDAGGGSGSDHCDGNVGLEDDVSIIPCGKKRIAARMITSDSEDEERNDKDGKMQEELGVTPSRKRLLCGLGDSDNEDDAEDVCVVSLKHVSCVAVAGTGHEEDDEDDCIPICEVTQTMRGKRGRRDGGELGETNGCSTFTTKRSAQLVKTKAKRVRVSQCGLDFVEPKECVESEDDSDQSDSIHEFINDEDCSANSSEESAEPAEPDESDCEVNYKDVMACIRRRRNASANDWEYEAEMLSAFAQQPELCLKAVCALYRKQTQEEQSEKASTVQNRQGFNQLDAVRYCPIIFNLCIFKYKL
jgi:hypothetical protein